MWDREAYEGPADESLYPTYPDLQPLLPTPLMESLDSSKRDIKLLSALQGDEYNIFRKTLDSKNINPWYGDPYHSSLLEIACQTKNRQRFVELLRLLLKGADPNIKNRVTGMPLLHPTARSGNLELLKVLLEEKRTEVIVKDNKSRTILHWWARVSVKYPNDKERLDRCFELLLQKRFVKNGRIEDQDSSGNTPFSFAVEREHIDRIILILNTRNDKDKSAHINHILQSASTSLLKAILDYCLDSNDVPADSKDLMVMLKFDAVCNMMDFLVKSKQPHHKDLLKHPVMSTFHKLV
jgi:ankyrin repeat protein